ncbi:MAG: PBP1A family penicillin-binding protein [Thermodesulfovibrio sp.]|uniref:penicillin-binding protein 1A n=1 Tax=unclassified Thermodesulfovibrio TaxID=2645936 RepID=UPI00083B21B7|nr:MULTISPECIES: PBP1A family penicillin-binding protein [unclassified Thermodesulfovibrio]MDI1471763.1 PBP1A family penicillin-binding protein [Thermodesulfovibrio sp. 1176]MDI6713653.1 PBP1A family penicillin-binding protein [Thermodesulfovibrio sp.]
MKTKILYFLFFSFLFLVGVFAGYIYWLFSDLPDIRNLEGYRPLEASIVYSSDGQVLTEFFYERRKFVPYYEIPDIIKKAFISAEDVRFYRHPGVDIIGIMRALYRDIKAGSIVEGGSTITQQLAKMLFLKPERSITRKIKEAILSIQIEKKYTKDEILGLYLNQAYFGNRAYGIAAAAEAYFGKSFRELKISEIALLASLPKAPSAFNPFKRPEVALKRRNIVLQKMLEEGFITKEQYNEAIKEPLPEHPHWRRFEAPYFVETLRQELETKYGERLYKDGLRIYSTIDYKYQKKAEESVQKGLAEIHKRVKPKIQSALIAIDLKTGYVKALVGGNDFWETQYNRVFALRQPGSAFKPFVYAVALMEGWNIDDTILDAPVSFPGAVQGKNWSPKNYNNEYHGEVSLRKALALSLNAATVRLASQVGIKKVVEFAQQCGLKTKIHPYLSTALGASDVKPIELTTAYSVFATGKKIKPIFYEKITDHNGVIIEENKPEVETILPEEIVEQMREFLREVVISGTAQRAKELQREVYGKTGTTNNYSDAWFVGFDDDLLVGVWVGRDNNKPIGPKEAGARTALPIWIDFMKAKQ